MLLAIVVIAILLAFLYLERHRIKGMLAGSLSQPTAVKQNPIPSAPTSSANSAKTKIVIKKKNPVKGIYLSDPEGKTLYVFDKDSKGVSNCHGVCAQLWPPFVDGSRTIPPLPKNISLIKRSDGFMQYAWKGRPLYYYSRDTKPGDIKGDGIGNLWHIITF